MTTATTQAARIAALNDAFRSNVGLPRFFTPAIPGTVLCTPGISALPPPLQIELWFAVARFAAFTEDNDPHGEHDFGSLAIDGTDEKVFWKIDYYANAAMNEGSEDPADPARSYRVLTIMLASEY